MKAVYSEDEMQTLSNNQYVIGVSPVRIHWDDSLITRDTAAFEKARSLADELEGKLKVLSPDAANDFHAFWSEMIGDRLWTLLRDLEATGAVKL